jgi:transcriptional regulator with XRE-family HTH domain
VRRLFEEANRQNTTLSEIAARAGLRRGTIGQWGRKNNPRVDELQAALGVLGLKLAVVWDDSQ